MYLFTIRFVLFLIAFSLTNSIYQGWIPDKKEHMLSFVHFGRRGNPEHNYVCGGVLITSRHVLTSAHCTIDAVEDLAFIGTSVFHNTEREGIVLEIAHIANHPQYQGGGNDLKIVTLKLPYNQILTELVIEPVAIDWNASAWYPKTTTQLRIMGFGATVAEVEGEWTPDLVIGNAITTTPEECAKRYRVSSDPKKTICFDGELGGSVTCDGDSGGPVVYMRYDKWVLVGIVEQGLNTPEMCHPGGKWNAVNIEAYKDWIIETVNMRRQTLV